MGEGRSELDSRLLLGRISDVGLPPRGATALLVRGGRIAAVGGRELVDFAAARNVTILDFGDRYIGPGFIDPHAHIEIGCLAHGTMVDCRVPLCRSIEDVLETLHAAVSASGTSLDWVVAQANLFFDQKLADQRLPTRAELDSVSKTVPIVVRAGGHVSILNTRALELSGVERFINQPGMMGAAVVHTDAEGKLTGVIGELDNALPLPVPDESEFREAIRVGCAELFTRYGVTMVGEITESLQGVALIDQLIQEDTLPLRVALFLWVPGTMELADVRRWPSLLALRSERERLKVLGVKMFADGGFSARNAATHQEYLPEFALEGAPRGQLNLDEDYLCGVLRELSEIGLQLSVHTNGERAQETVCRAVIQTRLAGVDDFPRPRLEHAGNFVTSPGTTSLWARAGIDIVPQPVFLFNFGHLLPAYLGDDARRGRFPFRTLIAEGWRLSGSSDLHLGAEPTQTNPLFSMWCCIKRSSFSGEFVCEDESISVDDAYRMHTIDAANVLGVADRYGSLDVGKVADLVVLERSPYDVPVDDLLAIQVDSVFLGGVLRYQRAASQPPRVTAGDEARRT